MLAMADGKMNEVLKLTRAGRVAEATALLRSQLGQSRLGRLIQRTPAADRAAPPPAPAVTAPLLPEGGRTIGANHLWQAPYARGSVDPIDVATPPLRPDQVNTGAFEYRIVANQAGTRRYKLYVPKSYDGTPMPLVVMLHGCTQSPDDFAAGTRMNEVADEVGCIVAYPEQRRSANAAKCWNWFNPGDQRRDGGEPSIIADIVRQIERDLAVDHAKVFVAGLSAGGAAAAVLAQTYPDMFAGVCVHSGLACGAAQDVSSALSAMRSGAPGFSGPAARSVPLIVFHGTRDHTVNPSNARHVAASATLGLSAPDIIRGRSAGGVDYTRTLYRDSRGAAAVEIWMLEDADHAWSGGSSSGSYTDPRGPDASREMMRFFLDR